MLISRLSSLSASPTEWPRRPGASTAPESPVLRAETVAKLMGLLRIACLLLGAKGRMKLWKRRPEEEEVVWALNLTRSFSRAAGISEVRKSWAFLDLLMKTPVIQRKIPKKPGNIPVEMYYMTGEYVLQLFLICLPSEILYCIFRGSFKSREGSAAGECFYILGCLMLSSNICLGCYFTLHFYWDDDNFCVLLNCKPASHNAKMLVLRGLAKQCITVDLQSIF